MFRFKKNSAFKFFKFYFYSHLLFQKLIVRNVPMCFVRLLVYWYTQQSMQIRWGRCYSSLFSVTNGVRQGSILSPYFFAVYIDDLSKELNKIKVGCFVENLLLIIYYLLMICAVFALEFMVFNVSLMYATRMLPLII